MKEKQAYTVKGDDADGNDSDDIASKEARKSNETKVSACAVVSPPVQLIETSRSVQNFNMIYDRLFKEF